MVDQPPYRVLVILDRCFGDRLLTLAENCPVWIIDSSENRSIAQMWWNKNPDCSHLVGITLFNGFDAISPEDLLIGNLETIDLHHGKYSAPVPYSILDVFGTTRTPRIEAELVEFGFRHLKDIPDGFRAVRTLPNTEVLDD